MGAADLAGEAERREEAAGLRRRASWFLERVAPADQCIVVDLGRVRQFPSFRELRRSGFPQLLQRHEGSNKRSALLLTLAGLKAHFSLGRPAKDGASSVVSSALLGPDEVEEDDRELVRDIEVGGAATRWAGTRRPDLLEEDAGAAQPLLLLEEEGDTGGGRGQGTPADSPA